MILGEVFERFITEAIERSENWLRRKNILESVQVIYATR